MSLAVSNAIAHLTNFSKSLFRYENFKFKYGT